MKKLLKNKKLLETITAIILFILICIPCGIIIYHFSQTEPTGESDMHCYWTTRGVICGVKLGGDKDVEN